MKFSLYPRARCRCAGCELIEFTAQSQDFGRQPRFRERDRKLVGNAQRERGHLFGERLLRFGPQQDQRAEYLVLDQDGRDDRRTGVEDFGQERARVFVLIRTENLEHLAATDGLRH